MQPLELLLFGIVSALALALIATLMRPYAQRRRLGEAREAHEGMPADGGRTAADPAPARATPPAGAGAAIVARRVCPACHREFSAGERFCPFDARDLVATHDSGARYGAPGMTCSRCGRSYDASRRFCAFDGEELSGFPPGGRLPLRALASAGGVTKICPSCSQRYEPDATFCARDGSELVSVN